MTEDHPIAARYLEALNTALLDLAPTERAEVVNEIRRHILDATAAGRPLDEVLTTLGPVEQLARAYKVELLLNPRGKIARAPSRADRWLKVIGLVALGSLPTFIVVVVLGSLGASLTASGVAVFVAGLVAMTGALPEWVHMDGVAPWILVMLGPIIAFFGAVALWGLVLYVKLLARLVRTVLPRPSAT